MERLPKTSNAEKAEANSLKEHILTHKEYAHHPFVLGSESESYSYLIEGNGKSLEYFGTSHSNNPENPLFFEIEKRFKALNPDIVYVEGMEGINAHKDEVRESLNEMEKEVAKRQGENFFALKLAVDANVDFESPEPPHADEITHLVEKGFLKQDIFDFYMYRAAYQYQRDHEERDAESGKRYLAPFIERFRNDSGWDVQELEAFAIEFHAHLEVEGDNSYASLVDPIPWDEKTEAPTNEVSRASSSFRNEYILERIAEGLKSHQCAFIVYGSAHAVQHEPALRILLSGYTAK